MHIEDIEAVKLKFANAIIDFKANNPFCQQIQPYEIAFKAWPEDTALACYAADAIYPTKEFSDLVSEIQDQKKQSEQQIRNAEIEYLNSDEGKQELKKRITDAMISIMENPLTDAKDRIGAADRLAKLYASDEKRDTDNNSTVGFTIINQRLETMSNDQFDSAVEKQQAELQQKLEKLVPVEDAAVIN